MKTPVAQPSASARKPVSLRPAFDDQPLQTAPATPIVAVSSNPAAIPAVQQRVPPPPFAPPSPKVAVVKPKPRIVTAATGEGGSDVAFAIQLGSFKSRDLAEEGWAKSLKVAGDLLNGLSHVIETVPAADGDVYRLFAEALPDREAALGLCRTLRDKGRVCVVVRR